MHLTINSELITTTVDHPFYVMNNGFINAGELKVGNVVINASGETYSIDSINIEIVKDPVKVYNFQVEDFHTYYAGDTGVLVHNSDCAPRTPVKDVKKIEVHDDGSVTYTKTINGQDVKVTYSSDGYPDFSPYAHPEHSSPIKIEYSGNRLTDAARANKQTGLNSTPEGYTWHHLQDGQSMMLVNETIHGSKFGFPHTGGFSINQINK